MRHIEPFAGGAALFFGCRAERALLRDINPDLIETYVRVRDDLQAVLHHLHALARGHDEERYYAARKRFNSRQGESGAERAALFIYLNKTCFNGLYRVNKSGLFNVPVGRYANPAIADVATLTTASRLLQQADIRCASFEGVLEECRRGDFVYLDPPYEPTSRTANFTGYAQSGFTQAHQTRLRDVFVELDRRGCKLMLSNSDTAFIRELYAGYPADTVFAPRAVNCVAAARSPVCEVIIRNYGGFRELVSPPPRPTRGAVSGAKRQP